MPMNDLQCPYCTAEQEVCHDDGRGYDDAVTHQQECSKCGKIYGFTTSISFWYEPCELPCANEGGEHDLVDINGIPAGYFVGVKRCTHCDKRVVVDEDANKAAIAKLAADLTPIISRELQKSDE